MRRHSKQVILELSEQLDERIVTCFNDYREKFELDNIYDLIEDVLMENYAEVDKVAMQDSAHKVRRRTQKTKRRWYTAYQENIVKYPDTRHPKNPFYSISKQYDVLSPKQWDCIYGLSYQQVIEQKKKEIDDWKNTNNTLLCEFPLLSAKKTTYIYNALRADIALNIYNIVKKSYSGSLSTFFRTYPEKLVRMPIFGEEKKQLQLKQHAGDLINDFFPETGNDDEYLRTIVKKGTNDILQSLDGTDLAIVSTFLSSIDNNFYTTKQVTIDMIDLIKAVYKVKTPSDWYYEDITKRCLNISAQNYKYYDPSGKGGVTFYFFEIFISPIRKSGERRTVTATFGKFLYDALINHKLISVTASSFDMLEQKYSKIFYYGLQLKRVELGLKFRDNLIPDMHCELDYSFFVQLARIRGSRQSNMHLINTSLDEFVQYKIAIESYKYESARWTIQFYALSDEEYEDLQFQRDYVPIIDEQS